MLQNRCHSNLTCSDVSLAQLNSYSPFGNGGHSRQRLQLFGERQVPQSLREATA